MTFSPGTPNLFASITTAIGRSSVKGSVEARRPTHEISLVAGVLLTVLVLAGCRAEISHDLDEDEATRIAAALTERGVPAETRTEGRQTERRWVVVVPATDRSRALLILRELELPARTETGLADAFEGGGLLPSPTEEQASLTGAIQGELVTTLESVDGVIAARVHISLPSPSKGLIPSRQESETTASVLIRYRGDSPPLSEDQVKGIVAGAVTDLEPERVHVTAITRRPDSARNRCQLEPLGPFSVSPSSVALLRGWLLATILAVGVLGLLVVVLALRLRRLRGRLNEPSPESGMTGD